ncbi:uncharacterized protein LOC123520364 isoform X3 [Portunus trituberculatus]|uniref:uncharacterized protein LOC123520364 isoform X3 n=1 Tax=Portunus trituberculatus TaxID=210409 RepID=UPI001E1D06B7|nr:uncharacterized protein LOC123520364 isoform X3 [Portunus trituberculatus]
MSEQPSQDGPPSGTPSRDVLPDHLVQNQDHLVLREHGEQHRHGLVQAEDADGCLSLIDDDDVRKMSQDSLISGSGRGSPLLRPSAGQRRYQDSDSCPSVSPSPDPESRHQTFDFSPPGEPVESGGITAALQTEREFLDFMLSLPQVQKEGPGRPSPAKKEGAPRPLQQQEGPKPVQQEAAPPLRADSEQRSPSRAPATVGGVVSTKMGLDHLDNLCRMMEQLGDLREQNSRLQRRVHYLEELQALQEMHRHLQETLEARRSGLRLDSIHLSDSDPHLDDDGEGGGGRMSRHGSEDSLMLLGHHQPDKGKARAMSSKIRLRSKSVGTDLLDPVPKTKVSGWKRVREALKWERATLLPPAPTPATATSAHHPTSSPQPSPSPQSATLQDQFFRPPSSSSSSSVLTEVMTEEDLLNFYRQVIDESELLELPESPVRRHSTTERDLRAATLDREPPTQAHDKEKKGHRSAWGMVGHLRPRWTNWGRGGPAGIKVKNMISTRRDSVRKKSTSAHRKSTVERPGRGHPGVAVEVAAASDPEDYEVDYDGQARETVDPGGPTCFATDGSEGEWEVGGVWVGPREEEVPALPSPTTSLGVRRAKPQLTITVPSSEDLSHVQQVREKPRPPPRSPEVRRRKNSPSQLDPRTPILLHRTPPSPRRASHWTKVKKAFLTGQQHPHIKAELVQAAGSSSLPPSPSKKTTTFHFDTPPDHLCVGASALDDSSSPSMSPLEASPDTLASHSHSTSTPSPQPHPTPSPQPSGMQRNLADLQKSLSGEFNRRLQEWEKLKSGAIQGGPSSAPSSGTSVGPVHPEENLPHEFRKKLHEWEKMKERERERGKPDLPRGQEDVKTKVHGEDDLPADFRKKLTEWEIRKALVGKSQQNVEELQKNLGEEFNRKMAEWERIKASASHGHIKPSSSASCIQAKPIVPPPPVPHKSGSISSQGQIKCSASTSQVLAKASMAGPTASPRLDRKGSGHKIKKSKSSKTEKAPVLQNKAESGNKGRDKSDKELQWLEKELLKVEREKQRLEREKEKFLERQARLEKMRQAMARGGPAKKKEIYIKTSTGEFRFEGISQTFTKRLYEWEERRGIRPESSTIALLDPNYKAPEKEVQEKPKSPELVRLVRSKSESSMVADLVGPTLHSRASSLSLGERETDEPVLQAENKAASEPTLAAEDPGSPKVAMLVQLEEVVDDPTALHDPATPYAPAEITRNIDSSGSEEDVTRRRRADDDDDLATNLQRNDSGRGHGSYRLLLHENMSLLDRLRQQEDLCRALETQMGDIDSKMDNVADQHLKTLEKLHRQVTIMKDSSTTSHDPEGGASSGGSEDAEANQRLINQLKSRIVELEMRGDHLMNEKEQLERAFKLHKDHETEIAESLVERIRELQNAGAEVNIQTVQCPSSDLATSQEGSVAVDESVPEGLHKQVESKEEVEKVSLPDMDKEREKRRKTSREGEVVESGRRESRTREHRKVKKVPSKKVQKLHNLTGDLLFQAKRLEQALVSKHNLDRRGASGPPLPVAYKPRSLRGRSSLRLAGDTAAPPRRGRNTPSRTWSSIEAITFPADSQGAGEAEGGDRQETEEGNVMTSRSLKGQSSMGSGSYSGDPQELLAMNAELSRMAKELRLEMMQMWSFRDSTSPESVTSEPMSVHDIEPLSVHNIEEDTTEKDRLVAEANEVFQSIAMLHNDSPPPSPHVVRSPSSRSRKSPTNVPHAKLRDAVGLDEKRSRRGTEDKDRRSNNKTPSRKNSYRKQQPNNLEEDEEEEQLEKQPEISVFGATLGELLLRTQHHHEEEEEEDEDEEEEEEEEEEHRRWEGQRRRSSDGLSTVTSGPSRSHSPSPSIASSAAEAESSSRVDEDEDSISLPGTWKTATTSTTRSGEHILSSSFEWEEEDAEERKKPRARWRVMMEDTEDEVEEQRPRGRWKAVVDDVNDDTVVMKPKRRWKAVVDEEEEEEEDGKETPTPQKTSEADQDDCTDFVTEVTVILPSARRATRDLKTRRISDTQVEYESFGQESKDECLTSTFSKSVHEDEALPGRRLRRLGLANLSRAPEDVSWPDEALPSAVATNTHQMSDKSPDVFVPTKRTIFTVQGGNRNPDQARATPTFVESQDEEQEGSRGIWRRSQSHPENVSEAIIQKPTRSCKEKNTSDNVNGHQSSSPVTKSRIRRASRISSSSMAQLTKQTDQISSTNEPEVEVRHEKPDRDATSSQKENGKAISNTAKEQTETEVKSTDTHKPNIVAEEGTSCAEKTPSHIPPPQPLTSVAITTALLQTPAATSPPIESKRKVLEAVNEGVPAVRNIIQKFNKRITENQELLGSPFRSPPSSPPWQSPRSQRKILADLNSCQAGTDNKFPAKNGQSTYESSRSATANVASGVLKSQSASVIASHPAELPPKVQRSASGSCVQADKSISSEVKVTVSGGLVASPQLSRCRGASPGEAFNCSSSVSPALTPAATDLDTSCDLEFSTEDTGHTHERLTGPLRPERRSPAAHIRALRIKKAKEEFLARGAGLPTTDHGASDTNETVKLRHRSGTASTEGSWRESDELCAAAPSPTPTEGSSREKEETRDKPPRVASRRRNIPKKESFRRQSAGCLLEESASAKHSSQVVKSSSSGVLANVKRHSRISIDSQSPDRRKESIDQCGEQARTPLGIFKLFRRNRSKDKRDMPSVQKLCRQSLVVDFANGRGRTQSASPQPPPEPHLRALPEVEVEEAPEAAARSSKTLPRGSSMDAVPLAPSRSCPSSPVAPHRSRTANWLARGRQIFKSRSPSPGKKAR